jgi:O-methyltransferase
MQKLTLQRPLRRGAKKLSRWSAGVVDGVTFKSVQFRPLGRLTFPQRRALVARLAAIHANVRCAHSQIEMARIVSAILNAPASRPGVVLEAGCFKGGSTAKLSIAAALAGRRLLVFDSFEGLPDHAEPHKRTLTGERIGFVRGLYAGAEEEVRANVSRFGDIGVCEFIKGWFSETMPRLTEAIAVAFIDVDLADSTRTCLRYIYPRLAPGGVLFSHDGNLPLCIEVFKDEEMWNEIGGPRPTIAGLGQDKLLVVTKPLM